MSITPAGFSIEAIEGGRGRKYLVTDAALHVVEVPSVTTILQVCDKPGLPWWGMKVGVEGVLEITRRHISGERDMPADNTQAWVDALTAEKLTVNHVLGSAGDRGTRVHDAFETWCRTGELPVAEGEDAGYLTGLRKALEAIAPSVLVEHVEVHVASLEYGFAGRTDAILTVGEGLGAMDRGRFIVDLKTSSGIYTSHFRQLSAYEEAARESGYGQTDGGYVLWVGKDGDWKLKRSPAVFSLDFFPVLELYESERRLKKLVK